MRRLWFCTMLASLVVGQPLISRPPAAQSQPRVAASLAAIERYPAFFHGRHVSLVATAREVNGLWQTAVTAPRTFVILPASGAPPSTPTELRGLLLDVGRVSQDDPRLSMYGLRALVQALYGERWPEPNTLLALTNATWVSPPDERNASLRAVVLRPAPFDGREVTLRGSFRGQNLYADLPAWPRQSQWDFVLHTADASIWVTGLRPRGRGFDLDPTSRRSSGAWLAATGTIRLENGLPYLQARAIERVAPLEQDSAEAAPTPIPAEPPPAVIFSAPLNGERSASATAPVRIQFSRDMDAATFEANVKVRYRDDQTAPSFVATYRPLARGLEIQFASPLASGATVTIDLTDGIKASDGTPLTPTTIVFTVER